MARSKHYHRYSDDFKARAVKLTHVKGVFSKDVAEALGVHPVMLLRWRSEYRRGIIKVRGKEITIDGKEVAELKRLRKVEREYQLLKEEHALLKKSIQFTLEKKKKSLSL